MPGWLFSDNVTPRSLELDLSQKQLQRLVAIENAVAGRRSVREAPEALGRSTRQVKRLKPAFDGSDPSAGSVTGMARSAIPARMR